MSEVKHTAPDSFVEQGMELAKRMVLLPGGNSFVSRMAYSEMRHHLERQAARRKELEEALAGLMVGCEYRSFDGDEPQWHSKQIPSNAALDAARSVLSQKEQG
jgi:hypothetical protein